MLFQGLRQQQPLLWINPRLLPAHTALPRLGLGGDELRSAEALLARWAPALCDLFPELASSHGLVESPVQRLVDATAVLQCRIPGSVWLKQDHALPIAGSIKARGGVYEVLTFVESLLRGAGLLTEQTSDVRLTHSCRELMAHHTISVGSTGNLGLCIGIMGSALGLQSVVHMSKDAKEWKKDRLRARGVLVVEHDGDFAAALAAGRASAKGSSSHYFVDDENSVRLFLGYGVAALRLRRQLEAERIIVDKRHPLFVYLPCGVGGAASGINFGLKHVFGDNVHCFFAEPCASPAMLLRLAFPDQRLSAYDVGLDNVTEADGLAVAKASELAASFIENLVSGVFTVADDELFSYLYRLNRAAGVTLEPSAAAGFSGPGWLTQSAAGAAYIRRECLEEHLIRSTHLVWTTGGSLAPTEEKEKFLARGRPLEDVPPAWLSV